GRRRVGAKDAVGERGGKHGRRREACGIERPAQEEVRRGRGPEAVHEIQRVLDRARVGADHVRTEADRRAAREQRAVAVAGLALIEVQVVRPWQGAEDARRRILGGQRELHRRPGGTGGERREHDHRHQGCDPHLSILLRVASDRISPPRAARKKRPLLAGRATDADAVGEAGIHAYIAEWIRAVRVLRAELAAGETAVVDAHLVGAAAAEAGTLAEPRAAAVERAVLPADAGARTLRVAGARCADAVPRVATVVAARVAGRAIRIGGADDAGLAGERRRVAFGGIA